MGKLLNLEYGSVFGAYWMYYGVTVSFASAFLLAKGFSNSEIGVILAVGSIVAVIIQPIIADISDRSKRLSAIGVAAIMSVAITVLTVLLFVFTQKSVTLMIVYVMIVAGVTSLQPLFNSLSKKLESTGHHMNFGVCRAGGSLCYAVMCVFVGKYVENRGVDVLIVWAIVIIILLLVCLYLLKNTFAKALKRAAIYNERKEENGIKSEKCSIADSEPTIEKELSDDQENINLVMFIKRNKAFVVLSIGIVFLYFQNSVFNNYMLQIVENVGGNSEDLGMIFSVMAFLELPGLFFFDNLCKKFSTKKLLMASGIFFTIKVIMMCIANSVKMIYVAHIFQMVSFPIFLPAMVRFSDEIMEKGEAVKGQALYTVCVTVSAVLASLVGGVILDFSGPKLLLYISLGSALLGLTIVSLTITKIKKKTA